MKLNINAVWEGSELVQKCYEELKAQNVDVSLEDVKIMVTNKAGAEIDLSADKLKIVVNKT